MKLLIACLIGIALSFSIFAKESPEIKEIKRSDFQAAISGSDSGSDSDKCGTQLLSPV